MTRFHGRPEVSSRFATDESPPRLQAFQGEIPYLSKRRESKRKQMIGFYLFGIENRTEAERRLYLYL